MFSDDKKNKHKEADGVNSKNSNDASDTKKSQGGKNERQFVNGGLDLVLTRNAFYRDKYYFTFFITIFLLFVVVVLFCIAYYFAFYPSKPQYFATTADGRMIRVHQLSDPVVPDDFVLSTNEFHSVREFIEKSFAIKGFDIKWRGTGLDEVGYDSITNKELIKISKKYFRPAEVESLLGDSTKARTLLGWNPSYTFDALIDEMVNADCK